MPKRRRFLPDAPSRPPKGRLITATTKPRRKPLQLEREAGYNRNRPPVGQERVPVRGPAEQRQNRPQRPGRRPQRPAPAQPAPDPISAAEQLRYGEAQSELERQQRISQQMVPTIDRAWQDYTNQIELARQRSQAGYQAAAGQIGAQAQAMQGLDEQSRAALQQQMAQQAQVRGQAPSALPQQEAQQASAARASTAGLQAGLVGTLGANANTYLAGRGATSAGIRAKEVGKEYARGGELSREGRRMAQERGAFRVTEEQKAKDEAWKRKLEAKAFGLDVEKERADQAAEQARLRQQRQASRRSARIQRRGQDVTVRGQDVSARERAADRAARLEAARIREQGKGPASFTPTKLRSNREKYRGAVGVVKNALKINTPPADLPIILAHEHIKDPVLQEVAIAIALKKPLTAKQRARFKRAYGFVPKGPSSRQVTQQAAESVRGFFD